MSESLGKILKKIRESKQISLEEASGKTRIPGKIISGIEEDRLDAATPFYMRGFVKSYAKFLGALEEKKVQDFLSSGQKKETPLLALKNEKVPGDWFIKHKRQVKIAISAALSLYLLFFTFSHVGRFIKKACADYRTRAMEKKEKSQSKDEVPTLAPVQGPDLEVSEKLEIKIKARYNTWIQVVSDGALSFRGAIRKGASDTWQAKKKIEIELGNAGAVVLSFNGKDIESLGKKGEKKRVIITKDGVEL